MATAGTVDPSVLLAPRNDEEKAVLVREAQEFAATTGLMMRGKGSTQYACAPLSLLPNAFPAREFLKAHQLAPLFNLLIERVANDQAWLLETLASVSDDFTQRLVEIYKAIDGAGRDVQQVRLGIHRTDFMLHHEAESGSSSIKNVEMNTISCSLACLSTEVSRMHRFLAQKVLGCGRLVTRRWFCPYNDPMTGVADGLALAHHEYLRQAKHTAQHYRPCVLMVVQPGERNINDQKMLELALWEGHGIPMLRATLLEVARDGHLDLKRRQELLLKSPLVSDAEEDAGWEELEVTVAYFRAGYTPTDYPGEEEWKGRELIEMSAAVKCPCISYHLVGTKKVQEALSRPGALERFLPHPADVALVRSCFTGLYGLEPGYAGAEAAIRAALARPGDFVLKPQREGGGNNLYDGELVEALRRLTPEERGAYILMEKIKPPPFDAFFLREGQLLHAPAAYEVGIYSVFLGEKGKPGRVLRNESVGQNLRTKLASSNEGGVAAGVGVLSSLLLLVEDGDADLALADVRPYIVSRGGWQRRRAWMAVGSGAVVGGLLLAVGVGLGLAASSRRAGAGRR